MPGLVSTPTAPQTSSDPTPQPELLFDCGDFMMNAVFSLDGGALWEQGYGLVLLINPPCLAQGPIHSKSSGNTG